jgi:hypothetical protein
MKYASWGGKNKRGLGQMRIVLCIALDPIDRPKQVALVLPVHVSRRLFWRDVSPTSPASRKQCSFPSTARMRLVFQRIAGMTPLEYNR